MARPFTNDIEEKFQIIAARAFLTLRGWPANKTKTRPGKEREGELSVTGHSSPGSDSIGAARPGHYLLSSCKCKTCFTDLSGRRTASPSLRNTVRDLRGSRIRACFARLWLV